jgi:EAL domain-containing protein (putative c-di-GMP-specific phosphodiesterase class I)
VTQIRVAIADDDGEIRAALEDLIRADPEMEFVAWATDAATAIAIAREEHPDVFVMDVRMPGGGGPRATREIRRQAPLTRVVALSAYEDRATILEMLGAGAVGYVTKGALAGEIIAAIVGAVDGQSTLSPDVGAEVVSELATRLEEQQRVAQGRQDITDRIRAVLSDRSALRIAFQPIVDLRTLEHVGHEALARFTPEPPKPPNVWFAQAEEVGLRVELEVAAIRRALESIERLPGYLSLNISPETIAHDSFVDLLPSALIYRLVMEVTEHAQVEDYELLARSLRAFRQNGGRLAVDDAGAGFASLRHILRLNPDVIKLDLDLTRGMDHDHSRRALASALITFASEIGATVIAEGIETEQELDALRALGVPFGQGYFLGRPEPLIPAEG